MTTNELTLGLDSLKGSTFKLAYLEGSELDIRLMSVASAQTKSLCSMFASGKWHINIKT